MVSSLLEIGCIQGISKVGPCKEHTRVPLATPVSAARLREAGAARWLAHR